MKEEHRKFLSEVDAFALDLDGTLYVGETPIGDMAATLAFLRAEGKKLIYLTNNSSRSEEGYREKLVRLGLWDGRDSVYSSGQAAASYLARTYPGKKVCLLGTRALAAELGREGVALSDDGEIALLGYDTELTYEKLCRFTARLRAGAVYIATHPDVNCPSPSGPLPDAGAFMRLIESSTGRTPDAVIGKPNAFMGREIARTFGLSPARVAMVGDRLYTDMRFAENSGMKRVLVLSGETTAEDAAASGMTFDLVLGSLNDLKV